MTAKAKSSTRTSAKASKKRNALEPYRQRAAQILNLYFNPRTPAFITDIISSWMTRLENDYQIHYANSRAVAEVFLPLALQAADTDGVDVEDPHSGLCLEAFGECVSVNEPRDRYEREPTAREALTAELEKDAAAVARLINSPHVPSSIKNGLADAALTFMDSANEQPEVIKAQWTLAVLASMEGGD